MLPLRFAIASSAELRHAAFEELRERISAEGGPGIEPLFVPNYVALFETVHLQVADVAWCPPLVARDLVRVAVADSVATVKRGGADHYYSVIVAMADSNVRRLAQLGRARIGWVSRLSAAGYVVPRRYLASIGVSTAHAQERFFHTHAALARALLAGEVDAIATYAAQTATGFELPQPLRAQRILGGAGPIPGDVVVVGRRTDGDQARALSSALGRMSIDPAGALAELLNASGFGPVAQDHFDALARWLDPARDGVFRSLVCPE